VLDSVTLLLFCYCMFICFQYTLFYLSTTVLSLYVAKCAHSYPQESLVRESADQKFDGDSIVRAPGSRSSVSLLFRGLRPRGLKGDDANPTLNQSHLTYRCSVLKAKKFSQNITLYKNHRADRLLGIGNYAIETTLYKYWYLSCSSWHCNLGILAYK
jgi:hypothetical protein